MIRHQTFNFRHFLQELLLISTNHRHCPVESLSVTPSTFQIRSFLFAGPPEKHNRRTANHNRGALPAGTHSAAVFSRFLRCHSPPSPASGPLISIHHVTNHTGNTSRAHRGTRMAAAPSTSHSASTPVNSEHAQSSEQSCSPAPLDKNSAGSGAGLGAAHRIWSNWLLINTPPRCDTRRGKNARRLCVCVHVARRAEGCSVLSVRLCGTADALTARPAYTLSMD